MFIIVIVMCSSNNCTNERFQKTFKYIPTLVVYAVSRDVKVLNLRVNLDVSVDFQIGLLAFILFIYQASRQLFPSLPNESMGMNL